MKLKIFLLGILLNSLLYSGVATNYLAVSSTSTLTGALTLGTQASGTGHAVRADRTITAGTGLTGGGNLTADRSIALNTTSMSTNYLQKWDGSNLVNSQIYDNATNIGIGTTSPLEKIHIAGNGSGIRIGDTTAGLGYTFKTLTGTGGSPILKLYQADAAENLTEIANWDIDGIYNGWRANFTSNVIAANPTASNHLTTKSYVDGLVVSTGNFVSKTGDTMTGNLTFSNSNLVLGDGTSFSKLIAYDERGYTQLLLNDVGISRFYQPIVLSSGLWSNNIYTNTATFSDIIIATGTFASGSVLSLSGAGTKMFWYPRKDAFRAGYVNGAQWDDSNIGAYSSSMGFNNTSSGIYSTTFGGNNIATASYSGVFGGTSGTASSFNAVVCGGSGNSATNEGSAVIGGYVNTANGLYSIVAGGANNFASGMYSYAAGNNSVAGANGSFALSDSNSAIFSVNTANVFGAYFAGGFWLMAGNVGVNTTNPLNKMHVNGETRSKGYIDESYALARSDSESTTTSTTYQTKTTLNYTPEFSGKYLIHFSFQVAGSDEKQSCQYRILQNDITTLQETFWYPQGPEAKDTFSDILSGFEEVTLVAGTAYNFKIQYRHTVAGKTCYIKYAKIYIKRIA